MKPVKSFMCKVRYAGIKNGPILDTVLKGEPVQHKIHGERCIRLTGQRLLFSYARNRNCPECFKSPFVIVGGTIKNVEYFRGVNNAD